MAWVKYNKYCIINLDRVTDIQLRKVLIQRNDNYGWAIFIYNGDANKYQSKTYYSYEEGAKAFNNLIGQLASNVQYIDITDI